MFCPDNRDPLPLGVGERVKREAQAARESCRMTGEVGDVGLAQHVTRVQREPRGERQGDRRAPGQRGCCGWSVPLPLADQFAGHAMTTTDLLEGRDTLFAEAKPSDAGICDCGILPRSGPCDRRVRTEREQPSAVPEGVWGHQGA
jgi:hypothetical protein